MRPVTNAGPMERNFIPENVPEESGSAGFSPSLVERNAAGARPFFSAPGVVFFFGCGKDNPDGMHLKFFFDEEQMETSCHFKLAKRYQGPPGHAHGGVIATILDEAMGKVNKFRNVIALTKTMEIEYMRPVPLGKRL